MTESKCNIKSIPAKQIRMPIVNWKDGKNLTAFRVDPPDETDFEIESINILEDR